jgi:RHS repeat-associated protein
MLIPGRGYNSEKYRFAFNGKESDKEWKGTTGAVYDYGFRIYDARVTRFLSVDPLTKDYPWYTPYQFAGNMPIAFIDIDGLEPEYNKAYQGKEYNGLTYNEWYNKATDKYEQVKKKRFLVLNEETGIHQFNSEAYTKATGKDASEGYLEAVEAIVNNPSLFPNETALFNGYALKVKSQQRTLRRINNKLRKELEVAQEITLMDFLKCYGGAGGTMASGFLIAVTSGKSLLKPQFTLSTLTTFDFWIESSKILEAKANKTYVPDEIYSIGGQLFEEYGLDPALYQYGSLFIGLNSTRLGVTKWHKITLPEKSDALFDIINSLLSTQSTIHSLPPPNKGKQDND